MKSNPAIRIADAAALKLEEEEEAAKMTLDEHMAALEKQRSGAAFADLKVSRKAEQASGTKLDDKADREEESFIKFGKTEKKQRKKKSQGKKEFVLDMSTAFNKKAKKPEQRGERAGARGGREGARGGRGGARGGRGGARAAPRPAAQRTQQKPVDMSAFPSLSA